jgi:hypothetical protein
MVSRQAELGEFHPDLPSRLGPVSEYHGTIDMQGVLDQGIRGGDPRRRSKHYVPPSLRNEDRVSYTTENPELAYQFALERAKKLGLPEGNVGVVGVRAGGLSNPVLQQEPSGGVFGGTQSNVRGGGIPRANIAPMTIKSDAYVQVAATCDCCSPTTQAFGALIEGYFAKGTTLPIRPQMPGGTGMYYRHEFPSGQVRNARKRMMREDMREPDDMDDDLDPKEEAQNHRDMVLEMLQQGRGDAPPLTMGDFPLKAQKKSKPFHGYNPKRHHRKGGLNAAGRAKFKRETGANLKPPVTTKPSKLKPGSKKAKRRKSFCARMSGSKGPTSKDGKLTPKGAALKRWNC